MIRILFLRILARGKEINMSIKTILLIGILTIATAALVFIAISPKQPQETPLPQLVTKPSPTPVAQTTLALMPNPLIISSPSGSLDVTIDTGNNNVTAVQLELSYDPKILSNVSIANPAVNGFFDSPTELLKKIDVKKGTISYAIALDPTKPAQRGSGIVATLKFRAALGTTQVTFLPQTLVTAEGISVPVLKSATDATVTYTRATPARE